jgi:ATP adenylyltransferase
MEQLWSPWRSKYIGSFKGKDKIEDCFVCHAIQNPAEDEDNLLVARFEQTIVMMNKYPYNNGHLLITPVEHKGALSELSVECRAELMEVINLCTKVIDEVYNPQGYNVGLNAGAAAGAGLPDHLHFHIVPRWRGDTNFTAVISDFKVINESMEESRDKLKQAFTKYGL